MPQSLIDFSQIAQAQSQSLNQAIQLGMLMETARRNRSYEEGNLLEAQRIVESQEARAQQERFKKLEYFGRLADDPMSPLPVRLKSLYTIGDLLNMPKDDAEKILGAQKYFTAFAYAMNGKDASGKPIEGGQMELEEAKQQAASDLMFALPGAGLKMMKEIEEVQGLTERFKETRQRIELNQARLDDITLRQGKLAENVTFLDVARAPLGSALADFKRLGGEDILKAMKKANVEATTPLTLEQLAKTDVLRNFAKGMLDSANSQVVIKLDDEVALQDLEARHQLSKDMYMPSEVLLENEDRINLYRHRIEAKKALIQFLNNPLDADAYEQAKKQERELRVMTAVRQEKIRQVDSERTALALRKEDFKEHMIAKTAAAQNEFAQLPTREQTPQKAGQIGVKHGVGAEEVMRGIKDPNAPLFQREELAESKAIGTATASDFVQIQNDAKKAYSKLSQFEQLERLLEDFDSNKFAGFLTTIQAVGNALGLPVGKSLAAKEAFTSVTNRLAMSYRDPSQGGGLPGSMSDADRIFLQSIPPQLTNSKEGNRLIIKMTKKLLRRDIEVAALAREYRKQHGSFDAGFLSELEAYSKAHPLFEDERKEVRRLSQEQGLPSSPEQDLLKDYGGR